MLDLAGKVTFKERSDKVLNVNDAMNWEKRKANAEILQQKHLWQHSTYSNEFNQCSFLMIQRSKEGLKEAAKKTTIPGGMTS